MNDVRKLAVCLAVLLCGCAARQTAAQAKDVWMYHVEYTVNGARVPAWAYTAAVPAESPVVVGVPDRLLRLTGCYENPQRTYPYTLQYDGEVLTVCYVSVPLPDARISVQHLYYDAQGAYEGGLVTTPMPAPGESAASALAHPQYGGRLYTPCDICVWCLPRSASSPLLVQARHLAANARFWPDDAHDYEAEVRYVRTAAAAACASLP